jgi:hypothetical protein
VAPGTWIERALPGGTDGYRPGGDFAVDAAGVLYGTTARGGTGPDGLCGTAFSLTPPASPGGAWSEAVLHSFTGSDGCSPQGVVIGRAGVLYGTTYDGGADYLGTVFSLKPPASAGGAWTENVIYSFTYRAVGGGSSIPSQSLAIDKDGVLYGTTGIRGITTACDDAGCGTVFSLTPPASPGGEWTQAVLYSFAGGPNDGSSPQEVVLGRGTGGQRVLYGVTAGGGTGTCDGCGTIFSLTRMAFG